MKQRIAFLRLILMALTMGFIVVSCIDPFNPEAVEFKSVLVIEATITDKDIQQEILISRTFSLDTTGLHAERGAAVVITSSEGTVYNFSETDEGKYLSNTSFAAQAGSGYRLSVTTSDGSSYSSDEVVTPQPTKIDNLYAERGFKDGDANEGMFIYVDSFDPTATNKFYRYVCEETYKIIAPFWSPADAFVVQPFPDPLFETRPRMQEERTCYNTLKSKIVVQENTSQFSENRITKFLVRFISRTDYVLSHRYSILVKQYAQSRAAFAYYETLRTLSESASLFSQIQTGFLEGNIKSDMNVDEEVVGFFEVSAYSEERIYFNYEDFFPDERLPDYPFDCQLLQIPTLSGIPPNRSPLQDVIETGTFKFYNDNKNDGGSINLGAPYIMVITPCSDCTQLGSNIKPDFWVDE